MIASLHGIVVDKTLDAVVIECAGVGYLVYCTAQTVASLARDSEVTLMTHLVVREDAMILYGFTDSAQKELFLLLQTVSKVGPKAALNFLNTMSAEELTTAISSGDAKRLTAVQGIGKQTANRVIVELKEKIGAFAETVGISGDGSSSVANVNGDVVDEVVVALVGLGFTQREAQPVVESYLADNPNASISEVLRRSLSVLGKKLG